VYTAYGLMKFIDSNDSELHFRDFQIRRVSSVGNRHDAQVVFPGTRIYGDEWVYERSYQNSQVSRGAYGFGRIPGDLEDTLLLLRLFKPGDVILTGHSVRNPSGELSIQFPQRITVDITTSSFFKFSQAECALWDSFASALTGCQSWCSQWFATARRFFLYGGAKEFNRAWNEVDRIVDYMIALEATLVPESGFGIGQRLRKRAVSLLGLEGDAAKGTNRVLRDFYRVRSALVHGSPLGDEQKTLDQMGEFESLVRQILVAALRQVPPDDERRRQRLAAWYDVPDTALVDEAHRIFRAISNVDAKRHLLDLLGSTSDI